MMEGRCKTEVLHKVRGRKSTELAVTQPQGAAFTWHAEVLLQEVPPTESTLWTALPGVVEQGGTRNSEHM